MQLREYVFTFDTLINVRIDMKNVTELGGEIIRQIDFKSLLVFFNSSDLITLLCLVLYCM